VTHYILTESVQHAREHFDAMGQDLPAQAVVITGERHQVEGRRLTADDKITWVDRNDRLDEAFFYLTIHLTDYGREQLRLQL
jgi:hypothetical protein